MHPEIEKVLKLPLKQKIIIFVLVLIVEAGLMIWFLWYPKYKEHQSLVAELTKLQNDINDKKRIVANLPKLQREYDELNLSLERALTELPNTKEIPSLLTSITTLGKNAGLDFMLFRPKAEVPKDFYAEVSVDITVSGSYYSVANFFAAVAGLPRIVNISNVVFSDIKGANGRVMTKVTCQATTFRFRDKEEIKNDKKSVKK